MYTLTINFKTTWQANLQSDSKLTKHRQEHSRSSLFIIYLFNFDNTLTV